MKHLKILNEIKFYYLLAKFYYLLEKFYYLLAKKIVKFSKKIQFLLIFFNYFVIKKFYLFT